MEYGKRVTVKVCLSGRQRVQKARVCGVLDDCELRINDGVR